MLCVTSYHLEAVLFTYLSSGWATKMGRLLDLKVKTALTVFPKDTATRYTASEVEPRFRNLSITITVPPPTELHLRVRGHDRVEKYFVVVLCKN